MQSLLTGSRGVWYSAARLVVWTAGVGIGTGRLLQACKGTFVRFEIFGGLTVCVVSYLSRSSICCFHRGLLTADMDTANTSVVDLVSNPQPYTSMSQPLAGHSAFPTRSRQSFVRHRRLVACAKGRTCHALIVLVLTL
jgi:hypothetical protein